MKWFKKKEKKKCFSNTLCIHITEDKLNQLAYNVQLAFWDRADGLTQKKRDANKVKFKDALKEFEDAISKEYPWIRIWTLVRHVKRNYDIEYYINVEKHSLEDTNI